jgi:hypothetical protein
MARAVKSASGRGRVTPKKASAGSKKQVKMVSNNKKNTKTIAARAGETVKKPKMALKRPNVVAKKEKPAGSFAISNDDSKT